ncbi:SNF2 family N-terminal domain-containing protein [Xylaria sp. FL1042]|nr:SNF2 family N-terminal domain-containing protein [Xylaria sp. FL1042]
MASDSSAYKSVNGLRLGKESGRSPVPKGVEIIDLTDDGDESSSGLAPPLKRLKISRSLQKSLFDDAWGSGESAEIEHRRNDIHITGKNEIGLDEPWVPEKKRKRESSEESSLFVGRSSDDGMQTNELDSKPDNDIAINGLRSSVLRAAVHSSWTPSKPNDRWTFSPEPPTYNMEKVETVGRTEEGQRGVRTYDTCFGMLLVEAETCLEASLPTECTPVIVGISGEIAKFYLQDQNICTAILVSRSLCGLLERFTVTLTGSICGKKLKPTKGFKRQSGFAEPAPRPCSVRIFVYGLMDEEFAVGETLSQAGMFLQHPGLHEIDENVKYHNPQYFLPPGQDMPSLGELRVSLCCRPQTDSVRVLRSSLGELERSQILKIFDSAYELSPSTSIEQSPRLQTRLKRHQLEALIMMIEKEAGTYDNAIFPPLWKPSSEHRGRYQHVITGMYEMKKPPPVGGGILADEMGLGKTLSTLSLICHSLDAFDTLPASSRRNVPRATLVITPKSTIYGWEKQIQRHIREGQISLVIYHGQSRQQELQNSAHYDIVLTTYETLRSDWEKNGPLFNEEWGRIVLDEAHKIRNHLSKTFNAVFHLPAQRRWCLTGTPIQNSLADFGALLLFIGVPPFDKEGVFANLVGNPVEAKKSGSLDRLRTLIAATTLRRTKASHAKTLGLPLKIERLETVELGGKDRRLYEFFKRQSYLIATLERPSAAHKGKKKAFSGNGNARAANILILIGLLRLICDHGEALLPEAAVKAWKKRDANAIDWEMLESGVNRCVGCDSEVDSLDAVESTVGELVCGHVVCPDCAAKSQAANASCPRCERSKSSPASPPSQYLSLPTGSKSPSTSINSPKSPSGLLETPTSSPIKERYTPSDKVEALLRNIDNSGGGKHVIFSYWTKMLDLIARALKAGGLKSLRIDGQASLQQRKAALEKFNSDVSYRVMLASIGAAGEGIELTAATTVHIIEPHWNPSAEAQAVDRVHRFGQERDVTVIRYVASDSIEEYVQWVQAEKLMLIKDSFSVADQNGENVHEKRWNTLLQYLE